MKARTSPPELANLPADFWEDAELVMLVATQAISLRDQDCGAGPARHNEQLQLTTAGTMRLWRKRARN